MLCELHYKTVRCRHVEGKLKYLPLVYRTCYGLNRRYRYEFMVLFVKYYFYVTGSLNNILYVSNTLELAHEFDRM
jgi:hypothetical protein